MILFYDTETTGLPPRNATPLQQPRLVQLGLSLCTEDGCEIASFDTMVKPEGFVVPNEAAAVHGVTTDMALMAGIPVKTALSVFHHFRLAAQTVVGHNVEYDEGVMQGEYHRLDLVDNWNTLVARGPAQCTALLAEPIMQIPPTERMKRFGYGPFKKPNLMEAHVHFLGEPFEGAHSALVDVRACARIYFAMKEQGNV